MIPKEGSHVTALPFGSQEVLTEEQLLDHEPYQGPKDPVTGLLEIIKVPSDYDFNAPAYILYLVDSVSVDSDTIEEIEIALTASCLFEFANDCHAEDTGRFCEKHGSAPGGAVRKSEDPSEIRKWARENGHEIGDRGRIPESIQKAYRKAQKAALATKVDSKTGDFKAKFQTASAGITDALKATKTEGYTPEELTALELRVNHAGRILHDEITSRLRAEGIRTVLGASDLKAALWTLRTQQAEALDKFRDDNNPESTSALQHFKRLYPGERYADATPDQIQKVVSAIDALRPGYKQAWQTLIDTDKKFDSAKGDDAAYELAYRTTALNVLSEAKDGNYGNIEFDRVFGSAREGSRTTSVAVMQTIERAGHVYPDDWVAESNSAGFIYTEASSRGFHVNRPNAKSWNQLEKRWENRHNSEIKTSKDPSFNIEIDKSPYFPTSVHEVGHRFEELRPHIKLMEHAFYNRRTVGESPQSLRELQPNYRYEATEFARPDKFLNPYMGKTYGDNPSSNYEIFTMGVQGMLGGSSYRIHNDPDYAAFILGILSTG